MSLPPPLTVNTPPEYDADPATAGAPTSASAHGDGTDCEVTVTLSKVAVLSAPALWELVKIPTVTGSVREIVVDPTRVQLFPSAEV